MRYGEHETFNRRCNLFQSSPGVYPADAFVGWYNGRPDYKSVSGDSSCRREQSINDVISFLQIYHLKHV